MGRSSALPHRLLELAHCSDGLRSVTVTSLRALSEGRERRKPGAQQRAGEIAGAQHEKSDKGARVLRIAAATVGASVGRCPGTYVDARSERRLRSIADGNQVAHRGVGPSDSVGPWNHAVAGFRALRGACSGRRGPAGHRERGWRPGAARLAVLGILRATQPRRPTAQRAVAHRRILTREALHVRARTHMSRDYGSDHVVQAI